MARMLLTGISGIGKTGLVNDTIKIANELGIKVHSISLGEIFKHEVKKIGANPARALYINQVTQDAIRSGIITKCAVRLAEMPQNEHVIIDAPLTIFDLYGIHTNTFDIADFGLLDRGDKKSLDLVVAMIDDEYTIARNLDANKFPTAPEKVLSWITCEISRAKDIVSAYTNECFPIVFPREHSRTSLIKLLASHEGATEEYPIPISYLARPISYIRKMERKGGNDAVAAANARKANEAFDENMQEHAVVIIPIENADMRPSEMQKAHTVKRDKNDFIRMSANNIVANYPIDVFSSGTTDEINFGQHDLAKITSLIHPNADQTPFGYKEVPYTAYLFKTSDEFFSAIASSPRENRYAPYRMFLDKDGQPRYKAIMEADRKLFPKKVA